MKPPRSCYPYRYSLLLNFIFGIDACYRPY